MCTHMSIHVRALTSAYIDISMNSRVYMHIDCRCATSIPMLVIKPNQHQTSASLENKTYEKRQPPQVHKRKSRILCSIAASFGPLSALALK